MSGTSSTPHVMLFLVIGLLLGGILREINKKTKFPYTPLLLITGLLIGHFRFILGSFGDGTQIISDIDPHTILLVFIPVLIFQSGFNCDWHIFRRSILNIIVLAAPGVLWGAILIAICFKTILGYPQQQLNWYQAFTLGSVLSATDPVAVVALLKQLGASVRFNTLIQGQSLLNDGTAMVFYYLFADLAKGKAASPVTVVVNFVRIAIGGPILGVAMGVIASWWMRRIIRDHILTTSVTVVSCYITFYLAQFTFLHVSGILALVVLGLYLSAVGKTNIYPQSQHALHVIWSYIQYACQTIIFLLTGVIIGVKMIQGSTITFSDWIKMLFFWLLMNIARFIMVLTFAPLLFTYGYPISKKQFVVLVYGGLRGALGLCLGLLAHVDQGLTIRFRQITLFYISGMATLTLLINGTTSGTVVHCLGMIVIPQIRHKLLQSANLNIKSQIKKQINQLKMDPFLSQADWDKINSIHLKDENNQQSNKGINFQQQRSSLLFKGLSPNEIIQQFRYRILRQAKKICWQRFEKGQCRAVAANGLSQACDVMMDRPHQPFQFWQLMRVNILRPNFLQSLKCLPVIGKMADQIINQQVFNAYDLCVNFLHIQQQIQQQFHHFPINAQYLKKVFEQLQSDKHMVQYYVCQLQHTFEQSIKSIHTRMAAYQIGFTKKNMLQNYLTKGVIDDTQYKDMRVSLDRLILQIQQIQLPYQPLSLHTMAMDCPLFTSITVQQMQQLMSNSQQRTFPAGTILLQTNKQVQFFYMLINGSVKQIYLNDYHVTKGPGSVSCIINCVSSSPNSFCQVKAITICKVLQIKAQTFRKIFKTNPQFQSRIYKASFLPAVHINSTLLGSMRQARLRQIAMNGELITIDQNKQILCQKGGFVFQGLLIHKVGKNQGLQSFESMNQVPPVINSTLLAKRRTVILLFKQQIRSLQRTSMVAII